MPFELAEWESRESDLPYYRGSVTDAVSTTELGPGIYVVKAGPTVLGADITRLGFQYLDTMLELTLSRPERPLTLARPVQTQALSTGRTLLAHHVASQAEVIFGNGPANRLYRTLPAPNAGALMRAWCFNSIEHRAERVGTVAAEKSVSQDLSGVPGFGAGFITVRAVSPFVEAIDLMGVHPDYRGQGVGTALAGWAALTSVRPVLQVRTEIKNQGAIGAYLKAGFRPSALEVLYWARVEG